MSTGVAIVVIPIIYKLDIEVKKNEHTMLKTAKKVMGMIDVDVFLLAEIVLGFCWGFHMNFSSVYILTELESSKTLFGNIHFPAHPMLLYFNSVNHSRCCTWNSRLRFHDNNILYIGYNKQNG